MTLTVRIYGTMKVFGFIRTPISWTILKEKVSSAVVQEAIRVALLPFNGRKVYLDAGVVKVDGELQVFFA
jgi:hypothetical protein